MKTKTITETDPMVYIEINDLFDELIVENKRLVNELLFANKCLTEMKDHMNLVHKKYEPFIFAEDINKWQTLQQSMDITVEEYNQNKQLLSNAMKSNANQDSRSTGRRLKTSKTKCITNQITTTTVTTADPSQQQNKSIENISRRLQLKLIDNTDDGYGNDDHQSDQSVNSLLQLLNQNNFDDKQQLYLCPFNGCDRKYSSNNGLNHHFHLIHYKPDYKPFICELCGQGFKRKFILEKHIHIHDVNRQKTYQCSECDKSFYKSHALKEHMLSKHSTEKSFKCGINGCEDKFQSVYQRTLHRQSVHQMKYSVKKVKDRYSCQWPGCDYRCAGKERLEDHTRVHTGERPFVCQWPECDKRFTTKNDLKKHVICHQNQKPFVCQWPGCDYRGNTSANLWITITETDPMVYIEINDLFDELIVENKRLVNELLFANKCLTEMKDHMNLVHKKYESFIFAEDINKWQTLQQQQQSVDTTVEEYNQNKQILSTAMKSNVNPNSRSTGRRLKTSKTKCITNQITTITVTTADPQKQNIEDISRRLQLKLIDNTDHGYGNDGHQSDDSLLQLLNQNNFDDKQQLYLCPFTGCDRKYSSNNGLKHHFHLIHYKPDYKPFVCELCGQGFKRKFILEEHIHIHDVNRQKTYQCSECDKSFYKRFSLKQHMLSKHSTEKSFKCGIDGCEDKFQSIYQRNLHRLTVHQLSKYSTKKVKNSYSCQWPGCDYQCSGKDRLENHTRLHTGERPFVCQWPECDKRFRRKHHLRQHDICHKNLKPYVCQWPGCDYRGNSRGNYCAHKKIHQRQPQ
ncbi:zinc finger protein 845-like [Oppia nitens]|uniref:zinc finger protein 845-like n=1 Tax=Oppia nitens TaxID=1686743 RepID=UPI0023DB57D0|nr:zinc finger protein 845-like [Oppia nitens]